jgi:hypothetical protein
VAEHTKKNVSLPAGLEQIRDKPVSGVGAAVEEEPMNYLAERIKSVFGEVVLLSPACSASSRR